MQLAAITLTGFSLSGRDAYDHHFDLTHLYHEPNYRALPHPLQIPQDGYAHGELAYASHSSAASLPGKHTSLFVALFNAPSHVDAIDGPCTAYTSYYLQSCPWSASALLGCSFSMTQFFAKLRALHVTSPA